MTPSPNGTPVSPSSPVAAKKVVAQRYHHAPRRTYIAGFSAAGYLDPVAAGEPARPLRRWHRLERRADDARAQPAHLPAHRPAPVPAVRRRRLRGGPPGHSSTRASRAGSEPTWAYSYRAFWDPIQRILREELDPTYDGDTQAGHPLCAPGTADCDADYDLETRPAGGQGRHRRHLPDRPHRQAAADSCREPSTPR